MCKISVIVPIYKVEKYLKQCLESVINQTYTDLEILLIDDGSPDQCGNICDAYAMQDCRIKVIHKKNQGIAEAYKDALRMAKGEWISFVDSDDWIDVNTYKVLMDRIEREINTDIIIFNNYINASNSERIIKNFESEFVTTDSNEVFGLLCSVLCKKYSFVPCFFLQGIVWNKLYRRSLFQIFDVDKLLPTMTGGQDTIINILTFHVAKKVMYVNENLYHFRVNPDSDTNKFTSNEDERQKFIFEVLLSLGEKFQLDEKYRNALYVAMIHSIRQMGYRKYFNTQNNLPLVARYREAKAVINNMPFKEACERVNLSYLDKKDRLMFVGRRISIFSLMFLTWARRFYQTVRYRKFDLDRGKLI